MKSIIRSIVFTLSCVVLIYFAPLGFPDLLAQSDGELLYNGIRLPQIWPPQHETIAYEPMLVPYLQNPPRVIPINVGRQLFVDDFLIESTTLQRTFHRPEPYSCNPVVTFDRAWEWEGTGPMAAPFSDGVWFDSRGGLFKLWYACGYIQNTCYAESKDGVLWNKPLLDVVPGTNIVMRHPLSSVEEDDARDSSTIWFTADESRQEKRYKMFATERYGEQWRLGLFFSPDGIHWSAPVAHSTAVGDRTTVFYNPFRNVWVYSLRISDNRIGDKKVGRARAYRENEDVIAGLKDPRSVFWTSADRLDPRHPNPQYSSINNPQLYNLDAVAYESLMLGFFSIWQGPRNELARQLGIQKRNEILIGYSRDGFHWHRPHRRPFIAVNETHGAWNWGNVQSVGGGCLVVGDQLYFYYSGRSIARRRYDGGASTGLAVLRRDGFASMDAGNAEGTLTTRPIIFNGKYLFVNVGVAGGELLVEVLDENENIIEPFSKVHCRPISEDKTLTRVTWETRDDLSPLTGKTVRFRFYVRNGSLYSFWVSLEESGASFGYVGGGGPGFTGTRDTEGIKAYNVDRQPPKLACEKSLQ